VNRSFLVREWGAVTFVLTVLVGIIIVPIALVVGNKPPPPPVLPSSTPTPTVSAAASTARINPPAVIPNG
jgi:hypothetical protein